MNSFFKNTGPYDINFLVKKLIFSKKKKFNKIKVKGISNLKDAKKGDISFLESPKYLLDLKKTKASFCVMQNKFSKYLNSNTAAIVSENPLLDFILIAKIFYPSADTDIYDFKQNIKYKKFLKNNTLIDSSVKIGKNFKVGLNTTIKKNVSIGKNVKIGSNCVISNSIIEDGVIINDGTVIGKIGYGFKYINNKLHFIPHIGCVEIQSNCYIGSNCSIDRGSFSNTVIGNNTMLDNQVHIAHNVKIGKFCFIAGQVGVAGSTEIGNHCLIGGQSGISGHLKIGNNVHIGGGSGVIRNLNDNQKVFGYPATDIKVFLKSKQREL